MLTERFESAGVPHDVTASLRIADAAWLPIGWQPYLEAVACVIRERRAEQGFRLLEPGEAGYDPEVEQWVAPAPPVLQVAPRHAQSTPESGEGVPRGEAVRVFISSSGLRYRVRITPMERKGALGVDWRLNAIIFESAEGEWIGSAPLYHNITLESLSRWDLEELLDQAMARG